MVLFHKIQDIQRLSSEANGLTEWAPVSLGDLWRTHAYSYRDFGMVLTTDNVDWLYLHSKDSYSHEWDDTDGSFNRMIAEASKNANLLDTNGLMNSRGGKGAAEHALSIVGDECRHIPVVVKDIGAGAGGTSIAFLTELINLGKPIWLDLELIDPSEKRLKTAEAEIKELLEGTFLEQSVALTFTVGTVDALRDVPTGSVDILITTAAIHHESFNFHLYEMNRVLKEGAPLFSGDWHESNYGHPARVYWIYLMLQEPFDSRIAGSVMDFVLGGIAPSNLQERRELKAFRKLFGLDISDCYQAYEHHSMSERKANVGSMRYWLELGKRFTMENRKCPEFMLQCHETVAKRVEALRNAGFVFDKESKSKYFEVLKKRGFGELGAVMAPRKAQLRR